MRLSIIIPVHNEERHIIPLLRKVASVKFRIPIEVIIVNDGSKDSSGELIQKFIKNKKNFKYIYKEQEGKGSGIIEAIKHASGDIITIQDADLEYDPADMKRLVESMIQNNYDIVYGNRFKNGNKWAIKSHYIGNILISQFLSLVFQKRVGDVETCYKMFRRKCIEKIGLESNDFRIEIELTAKFLKRNYNIMEIPIKYIPRKSTEGKKITWKDGLLATQAILKYKFAG